MLLVVALWVESELLPRAIATPFLFSLTMVVGNGEGVGRGNAAEFFVSDTRLLTFEGRVVVAAVVDDLGARPDPMVFPQLAELGRPVEPTTSSVAEGFGQAVLDDMLGILMVACF